MREALAGLTTRGRCFAYAGLACALCGLLLGRHDFVGIGLFLIVLSLGAAVSVQRTRYRLTCRRVIEPARVEAGKPGRVVIRLHNVSRLPTGVMLVEDTLPYTLGARPRFVLNRLESQGLRDVAYTLRSDVRGRYAVGPVTMRLTDPLGLCEVAQSFTSTDALVVTPQIWPLPPLRLGSGAGGTGESRLRAAASSGEDDLGTREYRHGDDLRRIHWRSTARAGELMVRREEQPWQSNALLVLDNRLHAHHGDGPGSSFEYACSAAASVGIQLLRNNFTLLLDRGQGAQLVSGPDVDDGLLLDELAIAELERTGDVPGQSVGGRGRDLPRFGSVVVAVLGAMTVKDAETVVRSHRGSGQKIAIALDTRTWAATPHSGLRSGQPAEEPDAGARVLQAAGWRVLRVAAGNSLAEMWNISGLALASAGEPLMNPRTQLAVAAAGVTLLSSTALHAVFVDNGWVAPVVGAVLAVLAGAELGSRLGQHLVARAVWRFVGSTLGSLFYATAVWAHQGAVLGFIPRGHTWHLFRLLFDRAFSEVHDQATPAQTYKALMLLTAVGVAAVAIAVDQLSVRAPLIGLPLLALYSVPEWLSKDGTGWIPLALGGGGYVGLLIREGRDRTSRWGRTVTGATTLGRNRSAAAAMSQAGWRIGAVALGTALVVPPLIPNLGHFNLAKGGGVSPSAVISYNLTANLFGGLHSNTQIPVYSYVSSSGAGEYLRLAESDTFVGDGFSAPTPVADPGVDPAADPLVTGFGAAAGGTSHRTSIAITGQFNQKELPIPVGTTTIANLQGQWAYQRQSTTVFAPTPSTKNQGYSTTSTTIDPTPETLQKSSLSATDRLTVAADLRLPADLPAAVEALALQVTKTATTPYEKAVALQNWFTDKKNFTYSLVGPTNGKNYQALMSFLTVTHSGFCQQFSSAMAVMARALDIPARVAFGFTSGIPDPNRGGTFHVNSQDGHAWPELYFSGLGWLRFEPTPRDDGQTEKPGYGRYSLSQVQALGKGTAVVAPGPTPTHTSIPKNQLDQSNARDHTPGNINGSGSWVPVSGSVLLWTLIVLAIIALIASLPVLNSVAHRRRRRNTGVPKEVALLAWRETLRDAFDLGHLTSVADSPRQTAQRIADSASLSDSARAAMHRLARAVERARYAPFAGDPLGLLDDAHEVSAAMYGVAPTRAKLRSRTLPPSTTLAMAEAMSRATSAVSRWGGGLADRLSTLRNRVTGRGGMSVPEPPTDEAARDEARLVRTGG